MEEKLTVLGARQNNLKNISLELPLRSLIVFTGVSGSGKSSLAVDTIYAEAQRRILENLSADGRGFFARFPRAEVDVVEGLPPVAVLIRADDRHDPRATAGTLGDIADGLAMMAARFGRAWCGQCEKEVHQSNQDEILGSLFEKFPEERMQLLAPVFEGGLDGVQEKLNDLLKEGFSRVRVNNQEFLLDEVDSDLMLNTEKAQVEVVIDRLVLRESNRDRLADSIELALRVGHGVVVAVVSSKDEAADIRESFHCTLSCPTCGEELAALDPTSFSSYHPCGACENCHGQRFIRDSDEYCESCHGLGLRRAVLNVRLLGKSFRNWLGEPLESLAETIRLPLDGLGVSDAIIYERLQKQLLCRLETLCELGLGYLPIGRTVRELSSGELSRLKLSPLTRLPASAVLAVLDEPLGEIHPTEQDVVIAVLKELRERKSTIFVIEHNTDILDAADYVVDLGPGAGEQGGELLYAGKPQGLLQVESSRTAECLRRRDAPVLNEHTRGSENAIRIRGACAKNLKNIDVDLPLESLVVVTGVSGAGKSALVTDTLLGVANGKSLATVKASAVDGLDFVQSIRSVELAGSLKTLRSCPATFSGVFDEIRSIFSGMSEARVRGWGPGRFSFNNSGGRCDRCEGAGIIRIQLEAVPEMMLVCPQCHGSRYRDDTLKVSYRGLHVADVLNLTVDQARKFFTVHSSIVRRLQALSQVGLGYLKLGQPATSLSCGEMQRLRLATELGSTSRNRTLYVFERPTRGLHPADIHQLLEVLHDLVERGCSVLLVDHHPLVLASADWIVELGPSAGEAGGDLVLCGTPLELLNSGEGVTGRLIAPAS